jgi:hypothetical protein
MSTHCEIVLRWQATPEELAALGSALWRWCSRPDQGQGTYRLLDNQPLADLLAGQLPRSGQSSRRGEPWQPRFLFHDEGSPGRAATIDRLRLEIPAPGVEDILVNGVSWTAAA